MSNFPEGLAISKSIPRRVLLQLGAKYYGVHLGPSVVLQEESDDRVHLEPNFHYPQEDFLGDFALSLTQEFVEMKTIPPLP